MKELSKIDKKINNALMTDNYLVLDNINLNVPQAITFGPKNINSLWSGIINKLGEVIELTEEEEEIKLDFETKMIKTLFLNVNSDEIKVYTETKNRADKRVFNGVYTTDEIGEIRAIIKQNSLANKFTTLVEHMSEDLIDFKCKYENGYVEIITIDTPINNKSTNLVLPIEEAIKFLKIMNWDTNQIQWNRLLVDNDSTVEFTIYNTEVGAGKEAYTIDKITMEEQVTLNEEVIEKTGVEKLMGTKTYGLTLLKAKGFRTTKMGFLLKEDENHITRYEEGDMFGKDNGSFEDYDVSKGHTYKQSMRTNRFMERETFDRLLPAKIASKKDGVQTILIQPVLNSEYSGTAVVNNLEMDIEGVAGDIDDYKLGKQVCSFIPTKKLREVINEIKLISLALGEETNYRLDWSIVKIEGSDLSKVYFTDFELKNVELRRNNELVEIGERKPIIYSPIKERKEINEIIEEINEDEYLKIEENIGRYSRVIDTIVAKKIPTILTSK